MIRFIDDHRADHGVEPICRVLPIAPATFYDNKAKQADPSRLLGAELTAHLGYEDGKDAPPGQPNRRNGTASKRLKGQDGEVPISVPRDRPSHRNFVSTAGQWTAVLSRSW